MTLEGRDILLLYGPPWDEPIRVSKHHLVTHLARRNRVLYVESPLHSLNLLARPTAAAGMLTSARTARRASENLWVRRVFTPVPYHAASPLTSSRAANRLAQRWIGRVLRRELERLQMSRPLVIAGLPHAVDLLPHLPGSGVVYHCADEYRAVRGFPSTLPALERELVLTADLVVVTAEALLDERRAMNPNTHWVPNGVEVDHFAWARNGALPIAEELEPLPRPVIGFVGALAEWVDEGLLHQAARALPDWSLVLVGPDAERMARLRALPNVHLLGPRPYHLLPRYLKGFDVAVVPFRDVEVARKADPIKVYEYLAAGLPVVATDLPALRRFGALIHLARDADEFVAALQRAVSDPSPDAAERRMAVARRHSWEARFAELDRLIGEAACGS